MTAAVAIIGSGSGGSSFSYAYPSNATLFSASPIGGRTFSVALAPDFVIDLGPSIIAAKNYILVNISSQLNITKISPLSEAPGFGVFDGREWRYRDKQVFGFSMDHWVSSSISKIRFMWRYGISARNAPKLAADLAESFLKIYDMMAKGQTFDSINDMLSMLDLDWSVRISALDYFKSQGLSDAFIDEIIGGIVMNTYGQSMPEIHAFAGLVSFYSSQGDVFSFKDGNERLFEAMLDASPQISQNLYTNVTMVERNANDTFTIHSNSTEKLFDKVVIACPIQFLSFKNIIPAFKPVPYVHVYTTIVIGLPSIRFFKLNHISELPGAVLIPSSARDNSPFFSFAIKQWDLTKTDSPLATCKFFSHRQLSLHTLHEIFDRVDRVVLRDVLAYPRLDVKKENWTVPIHDSGLYYVNGMEEWISTMETEAIAGYNIANLLLKENSPSSPPLLLLQGKGGFDDFVGDDL